MSYPAEGPIPKIDLEAGAVVVIEAVDPTTGATVAGVSFSNGIIYADGREGAGGPLTLEQQYLLGRGN